LIIGNFGLSYEQAKTQFAIWSILAAPLLMSVDLRTIRPQFKHILQNRKIIAVDQDPLGIQGRRIYKHKGIEIWSRPIGPLYQNFYSYAIAFVNRRTDGTPSDISGFLFYKPTINYTTDAGYGNRGFGNVCGQYYFPNVGRCWDKTLQLFALR